MVVIRRAHTYCRLMIVNVRASIITVSARYLYHYGVFDDVRRLRIFMRLLRPRVALVQSLRSSSYTFLNFRLCGAEHSA